MAIGVYPPSLMAHQSTNILIIVTSAVMYQVFITLKLNLKKLKAKLHKMSVHSRNKKRLGRNKYMLATLLFLYFKNKIETIFPWGANIDCYMFL